MAAISTYSLKPYITILQQDELMHLIRRCLFGVGHKDVAFFKGKNASQCLDTLLKPSPTPPPVREELSDGVDPYVKLYGTWINAPFENEETNYRRKLMLRTWWTGLILNRDFSITEKMTLFWHNHFATEMDVVKDSRYSYYYIAMLRQHALGNFKKLIHEGTTCPAMLVYLGGNTNFKSSPNENYARELMELFTLGKGYGVQYTEDDVKAAARVLTGWHDDKVTSIGKGIFDPTQHETADKHFSAFFDNTIIKGKQGTDGAKEIDDLVEMIFSKKEAARYVCRNIYRWFVYGHIDDRVEKEIIAPLGDIYYQNNFEIIPVLKTLLNSEHFFDPAFRACIVKSPADFLLGSALEIGVTITDNKTYTTLADCHEPWLQYHFYTEELSMRIGDPPSVAGWPAFYQAPKYHQWWINSASLPMRKKLSDGISTHEGMKFNGYFVSFDFLNFTGKFSNPGNLDEFVEQCTSMLCPLPLSDASIKELKGLLTSGMETGYYWDKAWKKHMDNPNDTETKEVLDRRLRVFYAKIFSMPEYHMM